MYWYGVGRDLSCLCQHCMSIVLFCLVLLLVVKSLLVSLLSVIAENRPVLLDVCQCRILLSVLNDIVDLMYCMNRCED